MRAIKERLRALREGDWAEFYGNKTPKCPHCGEDYDISDNEAWNLLDENGPHDVECPSCDMPFQVSSSATWTFSTDEQENEE